MCGRYYRDPTSSASPRLFHLGKLPVRCVLPPWDYNVAPTTFQPVIRPSRDTGEREIALMRWDLMPSSPTASTSSKTSPPSMPDRRRC
jgi:putative SOS response-associated peptidase YedK